MDEKGHDYQVYQKGTKVGQKWYPRDQAWESSEKKNVGHSTEFESRQIKDNFKSGMIVHTCNSRIRRQKQGDHCKLKANLFYIVSSRPTRAM